MPAIFLAILALAIYFFPQQVGYLVFYAVPNLTNTVTERSVAVDLTEAVPNMFQNIELSSRAQIAQAASAGPVLVPLSNTATTNPRPVVPSTTTIQPLYAPDEQAVVYQPVVQPTVPAESNSTDVPGFDTLATLWIILLPIGIFVSLLLAMWVVYSYIRLKQIRLAENSKLHEKAFSGLSAFTGTSSGPSKMQLRWERIVDQSHSTNENDWRQAILDADIMLDELLEAQGYRGDTMGDKLKQVEKSDFLTIDMAWEAHKVRNRVAHEGSAHSLNDREVRRVINLFERVFKEFHLID